jgi:hypothetical protein
MGFDLTRLALSLSGRSDRTPEPETPDGGIVLGHSESHAPVYWQRPDVHRAGHGIVLGSSGCGKTSLVANALVRELADEDNLGLFCVDPKGDTIDGVLAGLAAIAPGRLASVRYLDPFSPGGFPFNLCQLPLGETPVDIRALHLADLIGNVSTATGTTAVGIGARQRDVLHHCLLGALTCPDPRASLLLALDALELPDGLARLAAVTTSARVRQFCETTKLGDELRISCAARLRIALNATDSLGRLVAAPGCVSFDDLLAPGRIVLVNLGSPFGGLVALQPFFANVIARLAADHLLARPSPWCGAHVRVVLDEAQVVASTLADVAERILTVGRSKGISLTTITQSPTLIHAASDTLFRVLLTNAAAGKIIGRLSAPDAEMLSRERAPSAGVDDSIGNVRARFVSTITNLPDREFIFLAASRSARFRSSPIDTASWDRAKKTRGPELRSVRDRLALPPSLPPRWSLVALPPPAGSEPQRRSAKKKKADEPKSPDAGTAPRSPRSRWG